VIKKSEIRWRKDEDDDGGINWRVTFNDMITLLMVFFAMVFSLSTMDLPGIYGAKIQLQSGIGVFEAGKKTAVGVVDDLTGYDINTEPSEKEIENSMEELELETGIDVIYTDRGIVINLENDILFESGSADLQPQGQRVLKNTATNILSKISNKIIVEGHTDSDAISSEQFPSNWELSTKRAVNVVKYFIDVGGILPKRLAAAGYGETRPRFPNDSRETKIKNRRVEVVITTEAP
jgi:chemotaxis protein MotB